MVAISIVYLFLGIMIGFLVKHELDIKNRRKRVAKRLEIFENANTVQHDETLKHVKELNRNLTVFQQKKEAK